MTRSHVALALMLAAPVGLYAALAAPSRVNPTSPAAFFPTAVGTRWVYVVIYHEDRREREPVREVEVVTAVTQRASERVVTVQQLLEGDNPYRFTEYALSEAGVRQRHIPDPDPRRRYESKPGPWIPLLPARLTPGESWTHEPPQEHSRTVFTVAGWETVRVPAGAFHALRINIEYTEYFRGTKTPGAIFTGAYWHAPEIGVIKLEFKMGGQIPFRVTRELVSFTPGNR